MRIMMIVMMKLLLFLLAGQVAAAALQSVTGRTRSDEQAGSSLGSGSAHRSMDPSWLWVSLLLWAWLLIPRALVERINSAFQPKDPEQNTQEHFSVS